MSKKEVVQQVDKKIIELESPPDYLFSISLGESLNYVKGLDLREYPVSDSESATVARELLLRFEADEIDYDVLGACAFHMMNLTSSKESIDVWAVIEGTLHYISIGEASPTEEISNFISLELEKLAGTL